MPIFVTFSQSSYRVDATYDKIIVLERLASLGTTVPNINLDTMSCYLHVTGVRGGSFSALP